MAILAGTPHGKRAPVHSRRVMFDTVRGVLRVRKWPKKRGPPKSALQAWWVDWFRQANRLAKYADGMSQARAIAMTKGSGMYPRDVLLKAMRGRLYTWADTTGWRWFSMAAIGDVSNSLDVLGQTVGDVLVRAVDRWRPPAAGNTNDVLTNKGPGNPPVWQAPGGGVSQGLLAGMPITAANTVNNYVIDVTGLTAVQVYLDSIAFAATDRPHFQFSIDGGSTYKTGATDYVQMMVAKATDSCGDTDRVPSSNQNGTNNWQMAANFFNIAAGRCNYSLTVGRTGVFALVRAGLTNFNGPVTHIKLFSRDGNNFSSGTISGVGF